MPKVIVLTKKQKVDYYFLMLIDKLFETVFSKESVLSRL